MKKHRRRSSSRWLIAPLLCVFLIFSAFYFNAPILSSFLQQTVDASASGANTSGAALIESTTLLSEELHSSSPNGTLLTPNTNNHSYEYTLNWEPNIIHGSTHSIAIAPDESFFAAGGGYLSDNIIHIYAYYPATRQFNHVWDCGDGLIQGDVMALAVEDIDANGYYEVIAGSTDGHLYVFEQRFINLISGKDNLFNLVWMSSSYTLGKIWSLTVDDFDGDMHRDIVAGAWDGMLHVFEYSNSSGFPLSTEQWQNYEKTWTSTDPNLEQIYSVASGDTNGNGYREIIASSSNNILYIFEYNATNKLFNQIWNSSDLFSNIPRALAVGNLDNDNFDEVAVSVYGQGVFAIAFVDSIPYTGYTIERLYHPLEGWESVGKLPLDHFVDYVGSSQNWENDSSQQGSPHEITYPYNSKMGGAPDGIYAIYNTTLHSSAEAVFDFGKDEELGGGLNSTCDLMIFLRRANLAPDPNATTDYVFEISQDNVTFSTIPSSDVGWVEYFPGDINHRYFNLTINVDPTMHSVGWEWFRFLRIVMQGAYTEEVDAAQGILSRPITNGLSVIIDQMYIETENDVSSNKIIIGTSDGRLVVFGHVNHSVMSCPAIFGWQRLWDSYEEDRYSLRTNLWALAKFDTPLGRMPTWNPNADFHYSLGGNYSYAIGHIIGNRSIDLVVSVYEQYMGGSYYGKLELYQNTGTNTNPNFGFTGYLLAENVAEFENRAITASLLDVNEDGYTDLVVGTCLNDTRSNPKLYVWRNDSGISWTLLTNYFATVDETLLTADFNGIPYVSLFDLDNDGDLDLTVSGDDLYYFENTGTPTFPIWKYVPSFYQFINIQEGALNIPERLAFADYDMDNDWDLVICVNQLLRNRSMLYYYEQCGTYSDPNWCQQFSIFEVDFTFIGEPFLYDLDGDTVKDLILRDINGFVNHFYPAIDHEHLLVVTYPDVVWVEVEKRNSTDYWGYEAYSSWSTAPQFDQWTLTVKIGDTDGDGFEEVIVGSFDQNIYVFENIYNNTYWRSWRSPDFTHWTGLHRVWDDVTSLTIGDGDLDGNQEIIAVTNTRRCYIFENTGNNRYSLKKVLTQTASSLLTKVFLTDDIDQDGIPEIICTSGSLLFVYESTGDDSYALSWTVDLDSLGLEIASLAWGLLDADTYTDIVVVGDNDGDGVIAVLECLANNVVALVWTAPWEQIQGSPVNSVTIEDIDADNIMEIIIGHEFGVNIYQRSSVAPDNSYVLITSLGESLSHPKSFQIGYSPKTNGYTALDVLQRADGSFVLAYLDGASHLYIRTSLEGTQWSSAHLILDPLFNQILEVSLVEVDGRLHMALKAQSFGLVWGIWMTNSSDGFTWIDPTTGPPRIPGSTIHSICLTTYLASTPQLLLSYINPASGVFATRYLWNTTLDRWEWTTLIQLDLPISWGSIVASSHNLQALQGNSTYEHFWLLALAGARTSGKMDEDIWTFTMPQQPTDWGTTQWNGSYTMTTSIEDDVAPRLLGLDAGVVMAFYKSGTQTIVQLSYDNGLNWSVSWVLPSPTGGLNKDVYSLAPLFPTGFILAFIDNSILTDPHEYLYVKIHTVQNWWATVLGAVQGAVSVDTNNDGWKELVVGGGNQLSVFNYNSTTGRFKQIWVSAPLANQISDLAVGDTNNNTLVDLIVTAKGGNLYAFEWLDNEAPVVVILGSQSLQVTPGPVVVEVRVSDNVAVHLVEIQVDAGDWFEIQKASEEDVYVARLLLETYGLHTVSIRAFDLFRNRSPLSMLTILVKAEPPTDSVDDKSPLALVSYLVGGFILLVVLGFAVFFQKRRRRLVNT